MTTPFRILIIDDEPFAHKLLESYCSKVKTLEVVGNCYNGMEALNFLAHHNVDIILLDIEMPELSGIDFLETIQNHSVKVIMVSAYSNYAIDTYNFEYVVDYILKPIKFARFLKAIERARKAVNFEKTTHQNHNKSFLAKELIITEGKIIHKFEIDSLYYIQAYGNYVKLFLKNGELKTIRNTITNLEEQLYDLKFYRIHKSYIVNLEYVDLIGANYVQISNNSLPLGKSYAKYIREKFMQS